MADDTIKVDILTDTSSSTSNLIKYGAAIGAATVAIRKLYTEAVKWSKAASDAEEITNKFNVVFRDMAGSSTVVKKLSDNFDLADSTVKNLLSSTGDLLTGFGFTQGAALDLSEQVTALAADLASFSNYAGGTEGASQALTKALLGETESAKGLGIVINQNSDRYKELVKHYTTIEGKTEQQAKAYAALTMATEQSGNAIGDYERSSTSMANTLKAWKEAQKELFEEMGRGVNEGMPSFIGGLTKMTKAVTAYLAEQKKIDPLAYYGGGNIERKLDQERADRFKANAGRYNSAQQQGAIFLQNMEQQQKDEAAAIKTASEEKAAVAAQDLENNRMLQEAYILDQENYYAEMAQKDNDYVKQKAEQDEAIAEHERLMQEQRLAAAQTFFGGWAALAELGAEKSFALAVAFKALASAEAAINSYLAFTKALASAPWPFNIAAASGVLAAGLAQQIKINATPMPKFAQGGDFITSGPQAIMVGDNATGRERVSVEPLGAGSGQSGMIHNVIVLDGKPIADFITRASRDGRIITSARSIR